MTAFILFASTVACHNDLRKEVNGVIFVTIEQTCGRSYHFSILISQYRTPIPAASIVAERAGLSSWRKSYFLQVIGYGLVHRNW